MSANVLVQGPKIVELYTKWFEISARVTELSEAGHNAEAEQLMVRGLRDIKARIPGSRIEKPFANVLNLDFFLLDFLSVLL